MKDVQVHYLADVPQHGAQAMEWIYHAFGARPGASLDEVRARASLYANRDRLPVMFIATQDERPVGCVVLREHDMKGWEHLSPWLASMYVPPAYRGRGVASKLISVLEKSARDMGHSRIYLFTPDATGLYEKHGWRVVGETPYEGRHVVIMARDFVNE